MSRMRGITDLFTGGQRHGQGGGTSKGRVVMGKGAKLIVGGKVVRTDGSPLTKPSLGARRKRNRARGRAAKMARRANR